MLTMDKYAHRWAKTVTIKWQRWRGASSHEVMLRVVVAGCWYARMLPAWTSPRPESRIHMSMSIVVTKGVVALAKFLYTSAT